VLKTGKQKAVKKHKIDNLNVTPDNSIMLTCLLLAQPICKDIS